IIEPLTNIMVENNFEIKPVLDVLFKSEHFYDVNSTGCFIKSPIDYILSLLKPYDFNFPDTQADNYSLWVNMGRFCESLEQAIFEHPDVAGWKAYYQAPLYHETWINSFTLNTRTGLNNLLIAVGVSVGDQRLVMDVLSVTETMEKPEDPNELIKELAAEIYPRPLPEAQIALLKDILIPGLPDEVWTTAYDNWRFDKENDEYRRAVETQLRLLFSTMFNLPEFYLS
ncbi:MAG: DUF1800 family protein, partial [Bacteroidota bacterium]